MSWPKMCRVVLYSVHFKGCLVAIDRSTHGNNAGYVYNRSVAKHNKTKQSEYSMRNSWDILDIYTQTSTNEQPSKNSRIANMLWRICCDQNHPRTCSMKNFHLSISMVWTGLHLHYRVSYRSPSIGFSTKPTIDGKPWRENLYLHSNVI